MKAFDKKRWTVYVDDRGQHKLMSPNCEDVFDLVITKVTDGVGEPAVCEASFFVNLVPSRDKALEGYGVKTSEIKE